MEKTFSKNFYWFSDILCSILHTLTYVDIVKNENHVFLIKFMENTDDKITKKTNSRKFVVWMVWLILSIAAIGFGVVVVIMSKTMGDTMVGLIEKVLYWFFAISMMYLGMNVGQKVGISLSDNLGALINKPKEEKTEKEENTEEIVK